MLIEHLYIAAKGEGFVEDLGLEHDSRRPFGSCRRADGALQLLTRSFGGT